MVEGRTKRLQRSAPTRVVSADGEFRRPSGGPRAIRLQRRSTRWLRPGSLGFLDLRDSRAPGPARRGRAGHFDGWGDRVERCDELSLTDRHTVALGRVALAASHGAGRHRPAPEAALEHRGDHDKRRSDESNEQHRTCGEATAPKGHSRFSRHFFLRIVRYSLRSWHEIQAA